MKKFKNFFNYFYSSISYLNLVMVPDGTLNYYKTFYAISY
jgi:hypothetical protein